MGISGKSKIKKIVAMGANLRPDSTAVNSWAVKIFKKRLVKQKLKKRTLIKEITKQLLGLWVISQISQLKTYQNKKAKC
jgi:hypothetical protein